MTSDSLKPPGPWIWAVYAMLFAVAVPWYWPKDDTTVWLGMPAWVTVAILTSLVISIFTSWVWSRTSFGDEEEPEDVP